MGSGAWTGTVPVKTGNAGEGRRRDRIGVPRGSPQTCRKGDGDACGWAVVR
jgi:hypothetical protein